MWPCPRLRGVTTTTKKSPIVSRILGDFYSVPESESEDKEFLYIPNLIVVIIKVISGVGGSMHLSACLPFVRSIEYNRIIAFDKLRKEEHVHSRYLFGNRMGALGGREKKKFHVTVPRVIA